MKKLDLHIHTVATPSDPTFIFNMDTLKKYDDITLLCGDVPLLTGSMGRKGKKVVIRIKGKAEKNG